MFSNMFTYLLILELFIFLYFILNIKNFSRILTFYLYTFLQDKKSLQLLSLVLYDMGSQFYRF